MVYINSVRDFLTSLPYANVSTDQTHVMVRCPFCGDSPKSRTSTHFSIKMDVTDNTPMLYQCFQPDYRCQAKGILTTDVLMTLGCTNMDTLIDLAKFNTTISKKIEKYNIKKKKQYELVNLNTKLNNRKIEYINGRLGTKFHVDELRDMKIQLGLYDFLNLNNIHKLAFKEKMCDIIDQCCVGFVSMYSDYIIFRDISSSQLTKRRYTMYRTSGEPQIDDMKLYCMPTDIDLLDPNPANVNIAEGTFSILGAYHNTDIGKDMHNNLFLANCGTGYLKTIEHIAKQYGLVKMNINIFSDSEVKIHRYEKLYKTVDKRFDIVNFNVYYNVISDDFGHKRKDIKVSKIRIK